MTKEEYLDIKNEERVAMIAIYFAQLPPTLQQEVLKHLTSSFPPASAA